MHPSNSMLIITRPWKAPHRSSQSGPSCSSPPHPLPKWKWSTATGSPASSAARTTENRNSASSHCSSESKASAEPPSTATAESTQASRYQSSSPQDPCCSLTCARLQKGRRGALSGHRQRPKMWCPLTVRRWLPAWSRKSQPPKDRSHTDPLDLCAPWPGRTQNVAPARACGRHLRAQGSAVGSSNSGFDSKSESHCRRKIKSYHDGLRHCSPSLGWPSPRGPARP